MRVLRLAYAIAQISFQSRLGHPSTSSPHRQAAN
jgi:hypothetical protein